MTEMELIGVGMVGLLYLLCGLAEQHRLDGQLIRTNRDADEARREAHARVERRESSWYPPANEDASPPRPRLRTTGPRSH